MRPYRFIVLFFLAFLSPISVYAEEGGLLGDIFGHSDGMSEANERCRRMGFAPGSQPMADCISSALSAQEDQRARAERQDRDEKYERERHAAESDRETQKFYDKNRADADAWRNRADPPPSIFNNQ
jgi:hypothetical protein